MYRTLLLVFYSAYSLSCGCAASAESAPKTAHLVAPVLEVNARLYFLRTRESKLYLFRGAALTIDGERVAIMGFGTASYRDVEPGTHIVSVSTWDSPGRCTRQLSIAAGEAAYFEILPRSASFDAYLAGETVAMTLTQHAMAAAFGGFLGSAYEVKRSECSGLFAISPLDGDTGRQRMTGLALVLPQR